MKSSCLSSKNICKHVFFTVNHDFIWERNNLIKRCVNKLQLNEQNKWRSKDEHVFFSLVIKLSLANVQNIILSKPIFFSKKKKKKKKKVNQSWNFEKQLSLDQLQPNAINTYPCCEPLIQPQMSPPFHRYKIAKPLMC